MKKAITLCLAVMMVVSLAACGGSSSAATYKAGTYSGSAAGMNGDVTVDVTVTADKITEVVVTEQMETAGIADPALADIPAAIIKKQNAEVDAVASATITSNAIMEAVKSALTQAAA